MHPTRKRGNKRNGFVEPKNFRRLDRRLSTATMNEDGEELLGPHVSQAMKERIMKYKKLGSKTDPFSRENQGIIDELVRVAKQMDISASSGGFVKGNLAEATLLLEYSVKVFSKQVEATREQVYKLAEMCTRTKRSMTEQELLDDLLADMNDRRPEMAQSVPEVKSESPADASGAAACSSTNADSELADDSDVEVAEDVPGPPNVAPCSAAESAVAVNEPKEERVIECITLSDDEDEPMPKGVSVAEAALENLEPDLENLLPVASNSDSGEEESPNIPEASDLEIQSIQEPGTTAESMNRDEESRVQGENDMTEESNPVPRKRMKKDYGLPPTLISCFDEDPASDSDGPPELTREVFKRKERIPPNSMDSGRVPEKLTSRRQSSNSKDEIQDGHARPILSSEGPDAMDMDEDIELGATEPTVPVAEQPTGPVAEQPTAPVAEQPAAPVAEQLIAPVVDTSSTTPSPIPKVNALLEGVVIKLERIDADDFRNSLALSGKNVGGMQTLTDSAARGSFTPEDELQLLKFIQQLHALPFTSELSKEELAQTFEEAVSRLENIYKEHNVPVQRHVVKAASDACVQISNSYLQWLNTDKNVIPDPPDLHELFSQRCREEAMNSQDPERTIMETTEERTRIESNSKMHEMLIELQRTIVPKYTNIPLIEENTKDFFLRVKSFENRMKMVLAEEENKEEFDIRKYEMEVLDVAHSEVGDLEPPALVVAGDEVQLATSPIRTITPDVPVGQTPMLQFNFDGLPSPSCSSDGGSSGEGVRWISLKKIFSHMKTLGRQEAARMFYAVLALLSFENLDIKYDNHFSPESAALVAKNCDHEADGRFPRGVKIMTSRCADVDKEDVYIAALTWKSRTETFRELEFQHSQELGSGTPPVQRTFASPLPPRPFQRSQPLSEEDRRKAAQYLCQEFHIQVNECIPSIPQKGNGSLNGLVQTVVSSKKRAACTLRQDVNGPPPSKKKSAATKMSSNATLGIED